MPDAPLPALRWAHRHASAVRGRAPVDAGGASEKPGRPGGRHERASPAHRDAQPGPEARRD
eukprot:357008-Chlamydomonas_euryale.AAC.11